MEFTKKIYSRVFIGKNRKDAYLKACKWYATNIIKNSNEFGELMHSIKEEKLEDGVPRYRLDVFVVLNEKDVRNVHCRICQESHSSFFLNKTVNCNSCSYKAYLNRLDNMIEEKRSNVNEKMKKYLEGDKDE